jgi:hypothetical protein
LRPRILGAPPTGPVKTSIGESFSTPVRREKETPGFVKTKAGEGSSEMGGLPSISGIQSDRTKTSGERWFGRRPKFGITETPSVIEVDDDFPDVSSTSSVSDSEKGAGAARRPSDIPVSVVQRRPSFTPSGISKRRESVSRLTPIGSGGSGSGAQPSIPLSERPSERPVERPVKRPAGMGGASEKPEYESNPELDELLEETEGNKTLRREIKEVRGHR